MNTTVFAEADRKKDIAQLFDLLQMDEIFSIMQEEGVALGKSLGEDLVPGGADGSWDGFLVELHDRDRMTSAVEQVFVQSFDGIDLAPLLDFYGSGVGQSFVEREVATRRAFLRKSAENAARAEYQYEERGDSPRLDAIKSYVLANELIERNVVGALNSNYHFYSGLVQGGALELTEEDVLFEVWSQEDATREDTQEWLYAFLLRAYGPLSVENIQAYAGFAETAEGQALNKALFDSFDELYGTISLSLGLALAKQMGGETL